MSHDRENTADQQDSLFTTIKEFYGHMGWYRQQLKRNPELHKNESKWLNELAAIYKQKKKPSDPEMLKDYEKAAQYFSNVLKERRQVAGK